VLYGLREIETVVTRDVQVRLEPPQLAVLSSFHYVNHGGSEFVVYRATPEDVASGVRVGDKEYPGFPAKGVGITSDPALRVAFFALLFDPAARCADAGLRARRGRQRGGRGARQSGLSEAVSKEPYRDRRPLSRPRRAGHRRQHTVARSPAGRSPGRVPEDQRRPATREQRLHRRPGQEDVA
jgi:hypothetical protein